MVKQGQKKPRKRLFFVAMKIQMAGNGVWYAAENPEVNFNKNRPLKLCKSRFAKIAVWKVDKITGSDYDAYIRRHTSYVLRTTYSIV